MGVAKNGVAVDFGVTRGGVISACNQTITCNLYMYVIALVQNEAEQSEVTEAEFYTYSISYYDSTIFNENETFNQFKKTCRINPLLSAHKNCLL